MSRFGVRPEKEKALMDHMKALRINESDLREKFIRSGGSGGQRLNKVSTCVYLKHLPTGTEVKVQRERYQGLNRYLARRELIEKIETRVLGVKTKKQKQVEKIRKQKSNQSCCSCKWSKCHFNYYSLSQDNW